VLTTAFPKFVSARPPHSPLADELVRSQSGMKLPFASAQVRVVVCTTLP
jgi:hypothetical protein